jgi:hypothetical protein
MKKKIKYLNDLFEVFRWYYNVALDIYKLEKDKPNIYSAVQVSFQKLRDVIKKYELKIENQK